MAATLATMAGLASAGGSILGALGKGKGKGPTTISGYESMPSELKDYALDEIFPMMKEYGSRGYQGIPKRRLNASDYDPVFGSAARRYMQADNDKQAYFDSAAAPAATTDTGNSLSSLGMLYAQQMAGGAGGASPSRSYAWRDVMENPENYDLDKLASLMSSGNVKPGTGIHAGMLMDYKNGKPISIFDLRKS